MTSEVAPESGPPHREDAFWAALFKQEDKTAPSPTLEETSDTWPTVNNRADGRFRWADGEDKNGQDPWQIAQTVFQQDKTVVLGVRGYNKGGLLVEWNGLQGFVPASQLLDFPQFHLESERLRALKLWQQKELTLKIIELNRSMNRLILSERAALVEADERDGLLNRIQTGDKVKGHITNLTNFGAFVDLGGVEGLIHISELSWSRVIHPSDIVQPGMQVTVRVLSVDPDNGRIALSLKQLKLDPWASVDDRFYAGQTIEGVISNVVSFGAFVMIEEELEGLIHISELAEGSFLHPRNVVSKGQTIKARVLAVDGRQKRLALSLRKVAQ
ncbi:MAG: S1 RNA-binding domain-containing protein [Chloroflexi bacterium]|nr:MAG: S1 RNA-binding domain-containing protein [Chloroflexota bacterium]